MPMDVPSVSLSPQNMIISFSFLTSHSETSQNHFVLRVTDPLLAALSGHFNLPGEGAVRAGEQQVEVAAGQAADLPVPAGALVLAAGLEGLPVAVDHPVEHAVIPFQHCRGK